MGCSDADAKFGGGMPLSVRLAPADPETGLPPGALDRVAYEPIGRWHRPLEAVLPLRLAEAGGPAPLRRPTARRGARQSCVRDG